MNYPMNCIEARRNMLAARRHLLGGEEAATLQQHLQECRAGCREADAADAELSSALGRLPRRATPEPLKRDLLARWSPPRPRWPRAVTRVVGVVGTATALAAGMTLIVHGHDRSNAMVTEAVNDHLRVLYSENPVEIESGGIHQVKPWFAGRLDFAPSTVFAGDADYPLKGGSIAYFMDRKAATFVYGHGLHTMTLFVFRADGLPWPSGTGAPPGKRHAYARSARGFHTLMWREGDLGYAVVSDASADAVEDLAARVKSGSAP